MRKNWKRLLSLIMVVSIMVSTMNLPAWAIEKESATEEHQHELTTIVDNKPTCTEKGNEHEECTVCHAVLENKETSALGHNWGEKLSDGEKGHYQVCSRCASHTDTEEHHFDEWVVVKEATPTEEGQEKHTCKDCGYEQVRPITIESPNPSESPEPSELRADVYSQ